MNMSRCPYIYELDSMFKFPFLLPCRGRRSIRGHRHQNEAAHREAVEERRRFMRMEPTEPERRGRWTPALHPNPCNHLVSLKTFYQ